MSDMEEVVFCPDAVDLFNLNDVVHEGRGKISDNGSLCINLEKLHSGNTAIVYLIVEMLRTAKRRQCRVSIINISDQLQKLLDLYQLSATLKNINAC